MGNPPAFLFVVRHGLRLDAADKQWHLSSPTPYDPPLTYLGWQQAKGLGVRIGNIIREKVAEEEASEKQNPDSSGRKGKRYKVVIHSSPFLRCIQTSIAISAGLAQDSTPFGASKTPERPPPSPPILSPRTRPTILTEPPASPGAVPIRKSVLRLDAFLGEWLSPTYFELITPPPESVMMLASAKADLLRREDYSSYPNFSPPVHSPSQGHLWSPGSRTPSFSVGAMGASPDPLETMGNLSGSLPRSVSMSSQSSGTRATSISQSSESSGYVSPVPHWAVNNNNTIPPGYVAHARDACVDIDYQWDSMRQPLDWGDGGTFPEEWTSMHRRFRKGVQHLVDWYSTTENPTEMVTKIASRFARKPSIDVMGDLGDDEDVETESIVIMVSHGAGCNALIGAITHQPVLMDVAMASLTMAMRKPQEEREDPEAYHSTPRGWASPERKRDTIPVHHLYDLKIFASTDHLRSPPPTPAPTRSPSVASVVNGTRARYSNSFSSTLNNFSFSDAPSNRSASANAALSSLRRGEGPSYQPSKLAFNMTSAGGASGGITIGSGVTSFAPTKPLMLARTPSLGLWSPISSREEEEEEDDDDDGMLLDFSHEKVAPPHIELTPQIVTPRGPLGSDSYFDFDPSATTPKGDSDEPKGVLLASPIALSETPRDELSSESDATPGGLWGGGPRPPDDADLLRDTSSAKRRWTVTTKPS